MTIERHEAKALERFLAVGLILRLPMLFYNPFDAAPNLYEQASRVDYHLWGLVGLVGLVQLWASYRHYTKIRRFCLQVGAMHWFAYGVLLALSELRYLGWAYCFLWSVGNSIVLALSKPLEVPSPELLSKTSDFVPRDEKIPASRLTV